MTDRSPLRRRLMAGNGVLAADGRWHPLTTANGAGSSGGTRYGASETEADNAFADGSHDALIHEIRADKGTAITVTLYEGFTESGAATVTTLASSTQNDAAIRAPFLVPGGFHVNVSGTGSFSVVYEMIRKAGS